MKYLALLRGINVGGKNTVAMKELKACFEALGFSDVSTYINSGNIIFETRETDTISLVKSCEAAIEKAFGFNVVITVISKTEFEKAMANTPSWWGSGDPKITRSEALLVIPPTTAKEVISEIKVKPGGPDRLALYGQVVFWSMPRADYNKSVVPKIIGTPIYKRITMRSSTTSKKLLELIQ